MSGAAISDFDDEEDAFDDHNCDTSANPEDQEIDDDGKVFTRYRCKECDRIWYE